MFLLFGYNRFDDFKGGINDLITQADTLEELKEFNNTLKKVRISTKQRCSE